MFDLVVEVIWTLLSGGAVLLALWAMRQASQEREDTREELAAQVDRPTPNGVLILSLQQASQGRFLAWVHRCVFAHQFIFAGAGIFALLQPNEPAAVGTPLLELVGVPVMMLLAQYIIVVGQVLLVRVTYGQRKARVHLRTLELQDEDEMKRLVREMARQIVELGIQGRLDREQAHVDRGEEQVERKAATEERASASEEREDAGLERVEGETDREEGRDHRGIS